MIRGRHKKGRSLKTYANKIREIKKWYNSIKKNRQSKNKLGKDKKPLKSLEFFINMIKKATGEK